MLITIVVVFVLVYLGMVLGGRPFLQLDRTGVALVGAIVLIGTNAMSLQDAANAVHLPTLILLFSFMVLAAQMRLAGFYDWITRELAGLGLGPAMLLGLLMAECC
jgi:di/tricarboxylate transporter